MTPLTGEVQDREHEGWDRSMFKAEPCPLCKSIDIQIGVSYINPDDKLLPSARCNKCGCRALLTAWNSRSMSKADAKGVELADYFNPPHLRVAAFLLARDEACISKPVPAELIQWAMNLLKVGMQAEHSGDCTHECHSCIRCTADRALAHADELLSALRSTTAPERDAVIHTICPHIKAWSDSEEVDDHSCGHCPATVQTSQGSGVQMCRLNAEKAADAILALYPAQRGGKCICQDQHRRGYCTEPGCPYAVNAALSKLPEDTTP